MQEQWSLLRRVLLYPADGKLTQAIVDFAAGIPSTGDDRRRPGWRRYPQWEYVGWSPDPQMKQALIDYACSEKGRVHAEAVCYSLLTGGVEHTYASTKDGRLAVKLSELDWAPQDDPDVDIAYLAGPGMRIDQLGPAVILAACRQPFPRESYFGPHLRVMVLKGDGKVEELSFEQLGKGTANEKFAPRVFREVWAQSQAARAKLGLPPADPAQPGAAAAFLATSTQPASAPATEPSIPGNVPQAA